MAQTAEYSPQTKQTTLQKTITATLNELGGEAALVGIFDREGGPLVSHGYRGFSPREVQAVIRTLSAQDFSSAAQLASENGEARVVRLRLITPSSKALLALPLRYRQRIYGVLVAGRKDSAGFTKKERAMIESAGEEVTSGLERANLFDSSVVLGRSLVSQEPVAAPSQPAELTGPVSYTTPELEQRIAALLDEAARMTPFDRAWVTFYDPLAGAVEVLAVAGELRENKKDLKAGQRLALDASASGWAVRHRKPRVDQDLASTQGRFQDHKHLFKDRFRSSLVLPFFIRGQVGGTITLASKTPMQYSLSDARALEPLVLKIVEVLQEPMPAAPVKTDSGPQAATPTPPAIQSSEPLIRKQERQLAIGEFSAFLATEVREPLASIRAQLEEITAEGILDFDPQTRVENAMRDLIRVENILNEILDFAKPLELNRRICRIPDVIESALTLISTELDVNRIHVTKEYRVPGQARCDDGKMQQVFLSIFKNALEAMTPGGNLNIEVSLKAGRNPELQILIKNDGAPIPTEHVGKVFEPYFTTKRSGTGLGLATVKKIVEEHHGQISIASGPGQGTTVIIHLSAPVRGAPYRGRRGRGRRPPRR
jgi:signal transduction histidine kinase